MTYPRQLALFLCILSLGAFFSACGGDEPPKRKLVVKKDSSSQLEDLGRYTPEAIGGPVGNKPWVAHVKAVDLDRDGLMDVIACESKADTVLWLQQQTDGGFKEIVLAENMRAPVHVEEADMDQDGDWDLLVSCMSIVFPNNDKIGAVIILENLGDQTFKQHVIIENVERVTDIRAADFDRDGQLDLAVGQFGYDQGEVRWMRRTGPWEFESEIVLNLSGTIHVCVADFNGDDWPDFAALVSQQWEEIYLFENDTKGSFKKSRVLWGSTNEDYATSGMSVADLNQDGKPDILFTNGDGFGPTPLPGPRPWHGVQWLENKGNGFFSFQRIGDLGGAYSPIVFDMDDDGDRDIVALSSFNNWSNPKSESLVWFENDGRQQFSKHILSYTPTHLLTVDAADFDHSGKMTLVTGGFHAYPPYDRMSRILLWRPNP